MSLIKVSGNVSGTGIFTIASPNSNTDRTLNLPDASGTLFLNSTNGALNVDAAAPANSLAIASTGNATFSGTVKSNSGGFVFPDNTTQTTAASAVKVFRLKTYTASATYTKPSDVTAIFVMVAGATGGNNAPSTGTGGNGGGGYSEKYISSPASSYTITIGAGGAIGGTGGTTSFDTISITSSGGVNNSQSGSAGGVASGGTFNANGGAGGNGSAGSQGGGGAGGSRAGAGFAGGNGSNASTVAGGGGGGTGGAGGNGSGSTPGAAGAAATTVNASAVTLNPYFPAAGQPSLFNRGTAGPYGTGAGGNTIAIYGALLTGGNGGGPGGPNDGGGFQNFGTSGIVTIMEIL
jgi:hypothetical protein